MEGANTIQCGPPRSILTRYTIPLAGKPCPLPPGVALGVGALCPPAAAKSFMHRPVYTLRDPL
jgi:hypothetical protein